MRRREFITLLSGAAATWPLAAHAQQPAMPVIGFLNSGSAGTFAHLLAAFRQGLQEAGYVEGQNVVIEYRWAEGQYDRLPALAADLVRRQVAVIAACGGEPSVLAAKATTSTIPILFITGGDPVKLGIVASLNRPGGNVTGIADLHMQLAAKRLGFLYELLPRATRLAVLVNPNSRVVQTEIAEAQAAAAAIGRELDVVSASTSREIDIAFASLMQKRTDGLLVGPHSFFLNRRAQLVTLTARHALPTMFGFREIAEAGGLMSYGASLSDEDRQVGIYVGRVLKGEKPADLPIMQPTKFEFVINLQTARVLGIDVPPTLLSLADEVIE